MNRARISLVAPLPDTEAHRAPGPPAEPNAGGALYHVVADAEDAPRAAAVSWMVATTGAFRQQLLDFTARGEATRALRDLEADATLRSCSPAGAGRVSAIGEVLDGGDGAFPHRPGVALVYGDADAAVGAGIAAMRRRVPLLWVMPAVTDPARRVNRSLLGAVADLIFTAGDSTGFGIDADKVRVVGDPILDAVRRFAQGASARRACRILGIQPQRYLLVILTGARAHPDLERTLDAVARELPVIVHLPRERVDGIRPARLGAARLVPAPRFADRLSLELAAAAILTDSDRVLQEAAGLGKRHRETQPEGPLPEPEQLIALVSGSLAPAPSAELLDGAGAARRITQMVTASYAPMRVVQA